MKANFTIDNTASYESHGESGVVTNLTIGGNGYKKVAVSLSGNTDVILCEEAAVAVEGLINDMLNDPIFLIGVLSQYPDTLDVIVDILKLLIGEYEDEFDNDFGNCNDLDNGSQEDNSNFLRLPTFTSYASNSEAEASAVFGGAEGSVVIEVGGCDEVEINYTAIDAIQELVNDIFNNPEFLADALECFPTSYDKLRTILNSTVSED